MKIPRDCDGVDLAKALRKLGYSVVRQSGSHMTVTTQLKGEHHITIPNHRPIKVGTMQGLLKAVARHHGMSMEDLLNLLEL
jgi:predicted RNA binding protein YcfA (HicA-like mRNA interferase family)